MPFMIKKNGGGVGLTLPCMSLRLSSKTIVLLTCTCSSKEEPLWVPPLFLSFISYGVFRYISFCFFLYIYTRLLFLAMKKCLSFMSMNTCICTCETPFFIITSFYYSKIIKKIISEFPIKRGYIRI